MHLSFGEYPSNLTSVNPCLLSSRECPNPEKYLLKIELIIHFAPTELVVLLILGNLCTVARSSFVSFWRDRDIRKAVHLCPKRWELMGAVRAGGPLRSFVQLNETIVLQCRFWSVNIKETHKPLATTIFAFRTLQSFACQNN